MSYKSEAQKRFFKKAAEAGKVSQETVQKLDKASEGVKLPIRVGPKKYKTTDDLRVRLSELSKKKT